MATGGGGGGSGAVRAGAAFVELYTNDSKLVAGLKGAQNRVSGYAKAVAALGAGAALGALGKQTIDFAKDTAYVGDVAKALATPVEKLTGLFGVMTAAGSGLRESIESITQFGTTINNAIKGDGEAAEAFRLLNRSAAEFKRMDAAEAFYQLFASLERVKDPLEKTKILGLAFGTDGMKLLLPMLNKTSDELRTQAALYAMTAADVETARKASVAYAEASAKVSRAWEQVMVAVSPVVEAFARVVTVAAEAAAGFAKNNRWLTVGLVAVAGAAVAVVGALAGIGAVFGLVAIGAAKVAALFVFVKGAAAVVAAGLLTPWGLFAAAVVAAGVAVVSFSGLFDGALAAAGVAWGGIVAAVGKGDLLLAFKIAVAGIKTAWASLMDEMQGLWTSFKGFFVDGFHDATTQIALAFVDLSARVRKIMTEMSDENKKLLAKWLPRAMAIPGVGVALAGLAASGAVGAFNDLAGLDPEAVKQQIRDRAAAEQANRNMLRANAALGTAIMSGFARQRLQTLVDEANAGPKPAAPRGFQGGVDKPRLDKAVGAFLQGANGLQVFGSTSPQQMLLNENKKQTSVLQAVRDNTGAIKDQMKWIGDGLKFK